MKRLQYLFLCLFLFATLAQAQVTTALTAKVSNGSLRILWTFTQITDTTTIFYSPKLSAYQLQIPNPSGQGSVTKSFAELMNDFAYYSLQGNNAGFTIKQTKLTATPNTAIIFQGLSNSAADTVNAVFFRAAHVGQTAGDTSATFKLRGLAHDYRIKLTNTGGRITSGVVSLTFTKPPVAP